jgi:ATP dependent DNA ligase domain
MPKFEFCLPTLGKAVPAGKERFHEIKYDGYRIRLEREDDRVRLITKGGYDWTGRFPWIIEAARRNRARRFVIDGEAVILGLDGIADFNALHSGQHNEEVQLCAFDVLALDGEDLREAAAVDAQDQPGALTSRPSRWHLHQPIRERRNRARSLPGRLQYGTRRNGLQALRSSLPGRTIEGLDQDEEPYPPGL